MERRRSGTTKQKTLGEHFHHLGSPFYGPFEDYPSNLMFEQYMKQPVDVKLSMEEVSLVNFVKEMVKTKHGVDLGCLTLTNGGKPKVGVNIMECLTAGDRFKEGWFFLCLGCGDVSSAHAPTQPGLNGLNHEKGNYACYNIGCSVCKCTALGYSLDLRQPGVKQTTTFFPVSDYPFCKIALRGKKKIVELRGNSKNLPEVDIVCPPLKVNRLELSVKQKKPEEMLKKMRVIGSSLILENALPEEVAYVLRAMCVLVGIDDCDENSPAPQDWDVLLCLLCELAACISDLLVFIDTTSFMADNNAEEDIWYNTPVEVPNVQFNDVLYLARDVMQAVTEKPNSNFMFGDFNDVSSLAVNETEGKLPTASKQKSEEMQKLLGATYRKFLSSIYRISEIKTKKEVMEARVRFLTESSWTLTKSINPNLVEGALLVDFGSAVLPRNERPLCRSNVGWSVELRKLYIQPTMRTIVFHPDRTSDKTTSSLGAYIIHKSISEHDNCHLASLRYIMLTSWELFSNSRNLNPRHEADQSQLGSVIRESVSSNQQKRKQNIAAYKTTLNELFNEL